MTSIKLYLRNLLHHGAVGLSIATAVLYTALPLLWMLSTSFKRRIDIVSSPVVWFPSSPTLQSYWLLFVEHPFLQYLLNSFLVAASVTFLSMVFGTLAGYALARTAFPRGVKRGLGFWILSQRMVPPVVLIIPLYLMFGHVNLLNTRTALVIGYTEFNLPFVVWMTRSYFSDLPRELEESALVDGDSKWGAFCRIALPLAKPGLIATAMFCFLLAWNELLFALIFTDTIQSNTLPIGIASLITQLEVDWSQICAAGSVASLPIIVLAFIVQKHIVRGLTFGAVKG
jgi:multiple sugar transport system permease protein